MPVKNWVKEQVYILNTDASKVTKNDWLAKERVIT